ncbi:TetR family transcriptional regulator [Gordonia pseudamarae]|jgi:AcrR family transcriptional regulator|uniref:TetR family transcriptional regulator n=1 Tax=Gordonia pseudamarae TaxID=2831662 RepID=A0ABX6IL18_9ACTN|nr:MULTISPECIES: TetR/AcrR family transcriptional regulator [Gordonia]MBD0020663.1 TetR family transcriptional regulator [Gordonia sp. (in: high G+C Gram-positive bacteria)]QHN27706.1 TetR family transcriptional regulator [Gordonia pseudamarae]QHN36588.1 TetR family transcriptional regulator [Gordonia pseudamarae]
MSTTEPVDLRTRMVAESIRLFEAQGYEATTVDQIAEAAGVSRRTLFRQFRSKEDVIFADHEVLLTDVARRLAAVSGDPYKAVCAAAASVFEHFRSARDLAVRRYRVVAEVSALRERELITTYRYQREFEEFLRARLPGEPPERLVAFAAAVTGVHNYLLRTMLRGDPSATLDRLHTELALIRRSLTPRATADLLSGEASSGEAATGDRGARAVTVVTYPAGTSVEEVARQVAEQLRHP